MFSSFQVIDFFNEATIKFVINHQTSGYAPNFKGEDANLNFEEFSLIFVHSSYLTPV